MNKYKYAEKHFNQQERSQIWRDINDNSDVERKFTSCESQIKMIKEIPIKHRIREDRINGEKALGEIEIALKRIIKFPNKFSFTNEDLESFKEKFIAYEKELNKLDMQRISWD